MRVQKYKNAMIDASTLGIHRVPYAYLTGHIQANSEHGEYLQRQIVHFCLRD